MSTPSASTFLVDATEELSRPTTFTENNEGTASSKISIKKDVHSSSVIQSLVAEKAQGVLDSSKEKVLAPKESIDSLDYPTLATEHANLIKQGKTSLEIARWMGEKLNIASWQAGAFHGERKVLPTPQGTEVQRLQKFTEALGTSWAKANGLSDNHSEHLLLDGYVQHTLFGAHNMTQVDARLAKINTDWKNMGTDYIKKAQYLLTQFGLDIKGDWSKLTGIRYDNGDFDRSDVLYASGSLDGDYVRRMWLNQRNSDVYLNYASGARLCLLA